MIAFGVLGLGNIAHRFCRSLGLNQEALLYGVASSSFEKQQQFKTLYHALWSTSDYLSLIKNPNIDVVYIATRHKDHAYWVKQCLLEKKAVICEKPMALSAKETAELIALAKNQGVFLMEALKSYFIPGLASLLDDLQSGIIGEIQRVNASFDSDVPFMEGKYLFEKGQGGALNDVAIYPLSFVLKVIDEPISKIEVKYRKHPLTMVDSYFEATFHYASKKQAVIEGAIDMSKDKVGYIYGTKGMIEIPYYYRLQEYTIKKETETICRHIALSGDDMQGEIKEVIQCIKNKQTESQIYTFEMIQKMADIQDQIREKVVLLDD